MTARIAHLTSVHSRYDTRVFFKECSSLAKAGYQVTLLVADGKGHENVNGMRILDAGKPRSRIGRMLSTTQTILDTAIKLDADVYHLHDPELIPVGIKLKKWGRCVIFDAHEDVPKQILGKPYLNAPMLSIISRIFAAYETRACQKFDAIVTANPYIQEKFQLIHSVSVNVNNFPILGELEETSEDIEKLNQVCYVGGIAAIRGARELVRALEFTKSGVRLVLGGTFDRSALREELREYAQWGRVDELGFLDRVGVKKVLSKSMAGLVTLHPRSNYLESLPVKMFEYMSAGLPVIASDFPYWRDIILGNDCGLIVDPMDPEAIAKAIDFMSANPDKARQMGENGRRAVYEKFNWAKEEEKLLSLYDKIIGEKE